MERKRKTKTISIDPVVWDAVQTQANKQGISASRWLENYLFDNFHKLGIINTDINKLGEIRGGARSKQSPETP